MWKYDVYYDGVWIHEDRDFESEEEAKEEVQCYIKGKIEDWEADGVDWEDLFAIETSEQ